MITYIFIIVCNTLSNGTVAVHCKLKCKYNVYVRVYGITSSLNVIDVYTLMYVHIFGYLVHKLEIWWVYLSPIEMKVMKRCFIYLYNICIALY